MVKTKGKCKETVSEIAVILLAIAMIAVFIWILRYEYGKKETEPTTIAQSCVVTDCHNGNGNYVVTVESRDGNLWDYYSDVPKVRGYIVKLVFNGNEIIDVIN